MARIMDHAMVSVSQTWDCLNCDLEFGAASRAAAITSVGRCDQRSLRQLKVAQGSFKEQDEQEEQQQLQLQQELSSSERAKRDRDWVQNREHGCCRSGRSSSSSGSNAV
jgi:hypothetical protein